MPCRLATANSDLVSCTVSPASDLLSCKPSRLAAADSDFVSCTVSRTSDLLSCKPSRLAAADSDFISCSVSSTSDLLSCRPRRLAAANSDFVSCTASPTSDSVSCRFDPRPDTSPVFPDSSKGAENRSFSSDNARFCGTKSETPPKIGAVRSEPSPLKNSCETCPSSAVPSGFRTSPSRISAF